MASWCGIVKNTDYSINWWGEDMTPLTERIIEVIKSIPAGKVMTYGQVAEAAGNPRAARQVVRVLHSMSGKYDLPWHRVVNASGRIALPESGGYYEQRALLEAEGIVFGKGDRIALSAENTKK